MLKIKKLTAVALAVLMMGAISLTALAAGTDYGSAAIEEDKAYTLSEMLTYAIQDEYLAYAEYDEIIKTFGAQRPFVNIIKAEATHIAALEPLFEKYGAEIPENTAGDLTVVPDTLLDALQAGVEAEISNIAMYESFLKQDLPDDVRDVFTSLKDASQKHLSAFENGVSRTEGGNAGGGANQRIQNKGRIR